MSALDEIVLRRARLVADAQAQRRAVVAELEACRSVVVVADRGIALGRWLRSRPYLVVAAVVAIAVLKPRVALAWSARIATLWRAGRFLYDAVRPALTKGS
jgi:NOL1/NOP2/fmu family ribosome biogenesis protein